ncbi:hypothetical protein HBH98_071020 [Parastagonospora nodorum]|nr:hypothetical protein HBH51_132500 [Parastagonospora nodorum]KAH3977278.1 hypothetical protein HBH52_115320 [Parastagonospora nodorum]KAH4073996.1 hypothetical protein HBH50_040950 [Parastagonospora nodorum]KAH4091000.1 hypothetical protein HBH46_188430 [Parastagonospora nodorum]KAH4091509.1 hypothetical protein HBH48_093270 [Parastagonospora nodorum]
MDRIPPELHHRVCKYLSLTDLNSYRLVNKQFGSVGAANLFRQLVLHASFASVGHILAIAAHPLLRQHVQSLVWDANMWTLASARLPWDPPREQRIEQWLAEQLNVGPAEKAKYQIELEFELGRQYMQYRENIAEESTVTRKRLTTAYLNPILARFCQLSEIKIENVPFTILDGKINKSKLGNPCYQGEVPARVGNVLIARGEGMWKEDLPAGLPAQHAFETSLQLDTCPMKVLEVNHMHWKYFEPSISFVGCGNRASSLNDTLTTLSMTLTTYSEDPEEAEMSLCRKAMKSGALKSFIQGLRNLKDLTILMPYKSDQYCGAVHLSEQQN